MFRFGKQNEPKDAKAADAPDADLLGSAEEEEFLASVLEAQKRASLHVARPTPAVAPEQPEILWTDSDDAYRPAEVNGKEMIASLALDRPIEWKSGQSVIFVRRGTLEKIQSHLRTDPSIELGGLLVGQAFRDNAAASYFVVVEEALPALDGHGTATQFEYTSASWQAITPGLVKMDAGWTVVGSYHSHPNIGVFLSTTDKDTQADVFCHDWQIALVIDPVRNEIGFFLGERGAPCASWRIIS